MAPRSCTTRHASRRPSGDSSGILRWGASPDRLGRLLSSAVHRSQPVAIRKAMLVAANLAWRGRVANGRTGTTAALAAASPGSGTGVAPRLDAPRGTEPPPPTITRHHGLTQPGGACIGTTPVSGWCGCPFLAGGAFQRPRPPRASPPARDGRIEPHPPTAERVARCSLWGVSSRCSPGLPVAMAGGTCPSAPTRPGTSRPCNTSAGNAGGQAPRSALVHGWAARPGVARRPARR
jgi:hypothetical protein